MSPDHEAALAVVRSTSVPIHDIGTAIYLSPDVFGWAAEWGWSNPFSFYFAGRGGMLGDVSADVVVSAMGWFAPDAVRAMYTEGTEGKDPSEAAARMAEAHSKWGRAHYAEVDGLEDKVAVCEELVGALEGSAIPLFVGFREADRSESPAGRAAQLMQALREWRGGLHLVSTTAVGTLAARGDPHQRGRGAGKVLRLARAVPRRRGPEGQARRGRGDDRSPLRLGPGRGAQRRSFRRVRSGGLGISGRDAVRSARAPGPGDGRMGRRDGTG